MYADSWEEQTQLDVKTQDLKAMSVEGEGGKPVLGSELSSELLSLRA